MKKTAVALAASALVGSAGLVQTSTVFAQSESAVSQAQAEQLASQLGYESLDDAIAAGDIVAVSGGYALTSSGLAAAQTAGLLVSPALIPVGIGFGVAVVGLGVIAIEADEEESAVIGDDDDDDDDDDGGTTTTGTAGTGDDDDDDDAGDDDDDAGDDDDDVPPGPGGTDGPGGTGTPSSPGAPGGTGSTSAS